MSDSKVVKELLRERIDELAPYLFPSGRRESAHWCVGDVTGGPGKSFKICLAGDKKGLWGDFADAEKHSQSPLDLWMRARNVDFKTALREAAEWTGQSFNGSKSAAAPREAAKKPFDWQACVDAFTDEHLERLADWRGYSVEFCSWLKESGLVGLYDRCVAFPVHDRAGNVVAAHYRLKDGSWRYYPQGAKTRPLVIGELPPGDTVHVFESYWDAFAFVEKSGERCAIIITRGASNGALVASLIPERSTVYLWTQNDPAGEKWEKDICATATATVKRANIPARHKDLNDWTRAGATDKDLVAAMLNAGNSLNSQFLSFALREDYPEPPAQEAFYGLAGEIVRRIEPHTEADPAALLFQFLAAFGNLIGHDQYILADGTRHYLNLYGVLVGQSSKGRKGTSWNHVANVMERVEPEWRQDRISYGLSSGEGLIWAVRDPIEETKPIRENGRHTGEYETYIANHGEDDKRLLIIESEFANVLKVMAREGNTLSPVIRSAWDSGDLRTIVKNSPAKATKVHISIVGHITRDELRRLLTQTESANGFANRFCWLAVKRSKLFARWRCNSHSEL